MRKIGELNTAQTYFVIYYDEKDTMNPYKIYTKWYTTGWHKKLLIKYGNMYSCVCFIEDYLKRHYQ